MKDQYSLKKIVSDYSSWMNGEVVTFGFFWIDGFDERQDLFFSPKKNICLSINFLMW